MLNSTPQEHATGAKSAVIDAGDVPNNYDFANDVATNAQDFCARLDKLDLRMIFLFMPDWIFHKLALNVVEFELSCKRGFAPKAKYYFVDEKFIDELSESENRLLVVRTPEILPAALRDEIVRMASRTPKRNIDVMITVFDGKATEVVFTRRDLSRRQSGLRVWGKQDKLRIL